jgi:murein DD-endopeptidase MepM/ murein hydrolase activator NlpD
VGSHENDFGVSAPEASVTPAVPLTRREAKALWEAEQKAAAKAAKRVAPVEAEPVVEVSARSMSTPKRNAKSPKIVRGVKLPQLPKFAILARSPKAEVSPGRRRGRAAVAVAMAFVAGLAVATTVPANAFLSASEIRSRNLGVDTTYQEGQALEAADGSASNGRDKVIALQWGGVTGGGLYSNVSYVNNPLGKIQYPIRQSAPLSDMYGMRANPFGSGTVFHHGIDFCPGEGHPIQAIADGVVTAAIQGNTDTYGGLGYYVTIQHEINGHKVESTYAHMIAGSVQVKVGQHVRVTDILGLVGSTGAATGAHLHFVLAIDGVETNPWPWLQANAK